MDSMIYNPSEEFDSKFKALHSEKTRAYFDELVKRSGVNIEENRRTVAEYDSCEAAEAKLKRATSQNGGKTKFLRIIISLS